MAKRAKIEVGDWLVIRHRVTSVWPDGRVTFEAAGPGHLATIPQDDDDILEVVKRESPPAKRRRRGPFYDKPD